MDKTIILMQIEHVDMKQKPSCEKLVNKTSICDILTGLFIV